MRVASDVGGTFTDLVCCDEAGIRIAKADTTPPNFETGVMDTIKIAGVSPESFDLFAHGTTVVINALLSRSGVKTALITTKGFRDVLEIARGNRPDLFNFAFDKPAPFVPRYLRHEIRERVDYRGEILEDIHLEALEGIVEELKAGFVEAIAVCFLHAYVNPVHEVAAIKKIKEIWPECNVIASHDVCREWREYERTSTTVLSAYVLPIARRYLSSLGRKLKEAGMRNAPYIMQSNGGITTVNSAMQNPIAMVESGPASGILGAAALGFEIGEEDLIALDIGGTTAKCALIHEGKVDVTTNYRIEWDRTTPGYPVRTPVVDLVEIGSGGGSIAWLDKGGRLHVGPKSAGSQPGPAAYGRGGVEATTTDANLLLGRINPELFLGGGHEPDWTAVKAAFQRLADHLGGNVQDVARGVIRIANANMINALNLVSLNKGYDPREFTLIAFGGGGGMHAVALAEELRVKKVIVPVNSSVFSAWGMLMTDLRRDFLQTRMERLSTADPLIIHDAFWEIENAAIDKCIQEGFPKEKIYVKRYADLRYQGQEHTVKVAFQAGKVTRKSIEDAISLFHTTHKREFTFSLDNPVELVNYHIVVFADAGKQKIPEKKVTGRKVAEALKGNRKVDFDVHGIHKTQIYDLDKLEPGMIICGPAILENSMTTIVVTPRKNISVDKYCNIHIAMEA